jgi:hypothetical protein
MAIDITKLVSTFNKADFRAYVNEYPFADLFFDQYFPSQFRPTLTYESIGTDFMAKIAADVVSFDARAPRGQRKMPGRVTGDIPKVEKAFVKQESDINTYNQLRDMAARVNGNANASITRRLIEWTYGDSGKALDAVRARVEWMAKRLACSGKYSLTIANNPGGAVTKVAVDFGIPGGNISNASTDWDTTATADPVLDIQNKVATARAAGVILRFMFMDQDTWIRLTKVDKFQKFTASFANVALNNFQRPTLDQANSALMASGLPQIVLWDSIMNIEGKSGALTATTGWDTGVVTLSPTRVLGSTQWTTPADAQVDIDDSVKEMNDFTLVKTWAEQDPITMVTKGVAYATPVLDNASQLYIIKSDF